jgi:negative regulator of replication initiation
MGECRPEEIAQKQLEVVERLLRMFVGGTRTNIEWWNSRIALWARKGYMRVQLDYQSAASRGLIAVKCTRWADLSKVEPTASDVEKCNGVLLSAILEERKYAVGRIMALLASASEQAIGKTEMRTYNRVMALFAREHALLMNLLEGKPYWSVRE